jgi:hypothetical protein
MKNLQELLSSNSQKFDDPACYYPFEWTGKSLTDVEMCN